MKGNALNFVPEELRLFLDNRGKLNYPDRLAEPGQLGFNKSSELILSEIYVSTKDTPYFDKDPNARKKGYYSIPAISLTNKCKDHTPEFILLYLPTENLYGTWDPDHWTLRVFPDTPWEEIEEVPLDYVNAQWKDYKNIVSEYFKPYPNYEFKKGMPY